MPQKKVDGVIEAVHYDENGKLIWARVYERRGPTFSDRLLLSRQELIERLKARKRFYLGSRQAYMASTFDLSAAVQLAGPAGSEVLVTDKQHSQRDNLAGAPLF